MKTPGSDATAVPRRRWRWVLAGLLVLLLIGLLSDLGEDARDWIADLWDALRGSVAHNASPSTDRPELADDIGASATGVVDLSRPRDVSVALELARYRGQTSAAGQNGAAIGGAVVGAGGSAGGNPTGTPTALAALTSLDGMPDTGVELAATDQALAAGAGVGGGVGGGSGPVGESGPFSTVPGGPFVNGTNGGPLAFGPNDNPPGDNPPGDNPPGDSPVPAPEPGTLLLLGSAIASDGVRRWWRR